MYISYSVHVGAKFEKHHCRGVLSSLPYLYNTENILLRKKNILLPENSIGNNFPKMETQENLVNFKVQKNCAMSVKLHHHFHFTSTSKHTNFSNSLIIHKVNYKSLHVYHITCMCLDTQ